MREQLAAGKAQRQAHVASLAAGYQAVAGSVKLVGRGGSRGDRGCIKQASGLRGARDRGSVKLVGTGGNGGGSGQRQDSGRSDTCLALPPCLRPLLPP